MKFNGHFFGGWIPCCAEERGNVWQGFCIENSLLDLTDKQMTTELRAGLFLHGPYSGDGHFMCYVLPWATTAAPCHPLPPPPPSLLQMHSATKGFFCCFHALFTSVTSIHFMCLAESSNLTTFTSIILFSPSPTWFTRDLYYPLSLSPISFAFGIKVVNNCHRTWILYFGPWLLFFWFCFLVAVHLHRINFWALSSSRRQKRCRPKRLKPRLKP